MICAFQVCAKPMMSSTQTSTKANGLTATVDGAVGVWLDLLTMGDVGGGVVVLPSARALSRWGGACCTLACSCALQMSTMVSVNAIFPPHRKGDWECHYWIPSWHRERGDDTKLWNARLAQGCMVVPISQIQFCHVKLVQIMGSAQEICCIILWKACPNCMASVGAMFAACWLTLFHDQLMIGCGGHSH